MKIGNFHQDGEHYNGDLHAIGFTLTEVDVSPVTAKQGNGPDFLVVSHLNEATVEIGAAWKKTSKAGKPYLSVKLDGPTLAAPINCALIPQADGSHALVWNRDSRNVEEQAAA
jgi:uncharacterized protein (DUF736 family)